MQDFRQSFNIDAQYEVQQSGNHFVTCVMTVVIIQIFKPFFLINFFTSPASFISQVPSSHYGSGWSLPSSFPSYFHAPHTPPTLVPLPSPFSHRQVLCYGPQRGHTRLSRWRRGDHFTGPLCCQDLLQVPQLKM